MLFLPHENFIFEYVINWFEAYFDPLFNIGEGLNIVWYFHMSLVVISPIWPPFLHKLVALFCSVFGPWSELKVVLIWPIHHVSFTLFFCLVIILYTLCYSTFWTLFCIPFLAYLYTDFEAAIYCKCSYFRSIFSVVEGNFSVLV